MEKIKSIFELISKVYKIFAVDNRYRIVFGYELEIAVIYFISSYFINVAFIVRVIKFAVIKAIVAL